MLLPRVRKSSNVMNPRSSSCCTFPSIMRSKSYYRRFGSLMINRVKMSMINEGLLREVKEETVEELPNGRTKSRPGKKSDFVRLLSRAK